MPRRGIECPECACRHADVLWSRPYEITVSGKRYTRTRRSRRCVHCGAVWTTIEMIEGQDHLDGPDQRKSERDPFI